MSKATENTTIVVKRSFPLMSMLTVLFVGLKLTGFINWSWWWVLAPLWGPTVLAVGLTLTMILGLALFAGILFGAASIADKLSGR